MTRIGLLSDTHGYLDEKLLQHFAECHEIWHAGDIGSIAVFDELTATGKVIRAVFGNIDDHVIRSVTQEDLWFEIEEKHVFITHIGGYPKRYNTRVRPLLHERRPDIFICGHSHILKVIYDKDLELLHINPGAAGIQGLHQVRTAIRFTIDGDDLRDMQVIELGSRGKGVVVEGFR